MPSFGMFGGNIMPGDQPQVPQMPMPEKRGMFGGGKVQIDLGAALAGFAAGMGNPAGAAALRAIHEKRMMAQQQAMQDQQYQQQRADSNTDWKNHFDYSAEHAPPPQPTQTDRYLGEYLDQNTPKPRRDALGQILFPPVMGVVNGVPSMIDRASMLGGGGAKQAPPAEAIADLKANPSSAAQFDEIFGQGASAGILGAGGPTPPASGGFLGY